MARKRRSPRPHIVRTKHPRYNTPRYQRGKRELPVSNVVEEPSLYDLFWDPIKQKFSKDGWFAYASNGLDTFRNRKVPGWRVSIWGEYGMLEKRRDWGDRSYYTVKTYQHTKEGMSELKHDLDYLVKHKTIPELEANKKKSQRPSPRPTPKIKKREPPKKTSKIDYPLYLKQTKLV